MPVKSLLERIYKTADGELDLFGGPAVNEIASGRLRAAQIATVARFTPAMMIANVLNSGVLVAAFWPTNFRGATIAWAFLVVSLSVFIYLKRLYSRQYKKGNTASRFAIRRAIVNALGLGLLWAAPPLFFFSTSAPSEQIIVIALSIGMLCGGALALSAIPAAGVAFVTPLIFASGLALAQTGKTVYLLVAGLLIVYSSVLFRAMFVYATQLAVRYLAELENEHAALTDALTQLPNRQAFGEKLDAITDRVKRLGEMHSVLFLDLDRFKQINDAFGHGGGDEFLIQVASRLKICVREQDIVARISGDEFAIILNGIGGADQAASVADRILKSFNIPFRIRDRTLSASVTIGIAILPDDGNDGAEIMARADEAMYAAKRERGGGYRFFDADDERRVQNSNELLRDLRDAIANNEFYLAFQPFMELDTGLTTGFEALLRWNHPTRGDVGPAEFVPLAESAGLIHEIGEWSIRNAITQAARWPKHLRVAVNVSAAQFRTLEIASIIENAIGASGISSDRVEIELTESMILADVERAQHAMSRLRDLGVKIALDDFGTGYSSLNNLVRLPIDRIKIDQFFTSRSDRSRECEKVVRAIVRLAAEFQIDVIAEGVETAGQIELLKEIGCKEAQGFFIGKPMTDIASSDFAVSCYQLRAKAA